MTVYFAYRSHYEGPTGIHLKRFDNDTVLEWFQQHWHAAKDSDDAYAYAKDLIGTSVYGLGSLFAEIGENSLEKPGSDRQLSAYLDEHLYVEGEIIFTPHAIQVLTDDDELEMGYYIFDDHYLAKQPGKAAFLLQEDWQLPTNFVKEDEASDSDSKTYMIFIAYYDSGNLSDLDAFDLYSEISSIRLPELCQSLYNSTPDEEWSYEMKLFRSQIPLTLPDDALKITLERAALFSVSTIYNLSSDEHFGNGSVAEIQEYLKERLIEFASKTPLEFNAKKPLIQVDQHVAQLFILTDKQDNNDNKVDGNELYQRWIFFDDLWLKANPDLGKSIITFSQRWDVLS